MSSRPEPDALDKNVSPADRELTRLLGLIDDLLDRLEEADAPWQVWLAEVTADYRSSAANMVHYWAIRQCDLRELQRRLAAFGLSSLGRSEPHVQATLRLVRCAALAMLKGSWAPPAPAVVQPEQSRHLLRRRAVELLGPAPVGHEARIMVTLPSEAATDPDLVRRLIEGGMSIARINCAHDDAEAWRAMAHHVRQASRLTGHGCLVAMDLAGPKLRTGPIQPGPRCLKLRPSRDVLGRVLAPARAWLTAAEHPAAPPEPGMTTLPVSGQWLARRREGDVVRMRDARGANRHLLLSSDAGGAHGFVGTTDKATYLVTGMTLEVDHADDPTAVGALPEHEQSLVLHPGDLLNVTQDCSPASVDFDRAAQIGCTLPELFDNAQVGESIYFDDGKIGGQIIEVHAGMVQVRITRADVGGTKLRAAKGINVPDTRLPVPALTDKDFADLATVVEIADLVELSFVQDPSDIVGLHEALTRLDADKLGVVLKIETRRAFEHLPQLLLTAMRRPRVGVMIARGDLAVEVGYERLAELQEEILWLCEAAHLPVIWATQVLEQLATSGLPSRAEISDAAMGERAECVMLNKGPHVEEAVRVLDDILRRMARHHYKKNALLRRLRSWHPEPVT
ncbi:pyruvate kinase [Mycobacterium sp. 852013-50091_SCH5140682]|uniref:pyruvate kinase n=1 Tax=Mycobacterium sp. 852013-50091_SCH5140682 TaxID=1834109 RepID=UPI0007EAC550|nr:pyruvate kinase [Mycobacterium sp. 852013-50091_SCH5140682]OBC00530.1 pyruvate kinase [Mycobacterium sp. 852013-50091_SCH5140682]